MGPRSPPRISRLLPRRSGGVWGRPGLLFTRGVRLRSRPRPAATPGKRREVAAARFFLWFPPLSFHFSLLFFFSSLLLSPFSFLRPRRDDFFSGVGAEWDHGHYLALGLGSQL